MEIGKCKEAKKEQIELSTSKDLSEMKHLKVGEAKGYELELGSGAFIPGFEEQLEGKVAPVDTLK